MATSTAAVDTSARIMRAFAARTGLDGDGEPGRRYLWTDAHAVCNFLGLAEATGDDGYRDLAERLVDRVHAELGRHRDDDARRGWISGLDEKTGARHPTTGGLRIGKARNERPSARDFDPVAEWDRDGQYFHYLTKWMHALSRTAAETGRPDYLRWAIELAVAAYEGFLVRDRATGREYLAWKMRIDLSEPLVPSAGLHDPLDGYVTARELEFRAGLHEDGDAAAELRAAIAGLENMLASDYPLTDDPLGIGGMLFDAARVAQLADAGQHGHGRLLASLLASAAAGLDAFASGGTLRLPAERRLAFRELGLSIGLHGVAGIRAALARGERGERDRHGAGEEGERDRHSAGRSAGDRHAIAERLTGLDRYTSLTDRIERFWLDSASQSSRTWQEHLDINAVMLATSLLPAAFLRV